MDAVADIKGRLDIVDVVSEYIPLKPGGSGAFKANCPFHQERTPSFYVSRPRQSWHCFGCDQGGDFISFVMKIEGMEFREALEHLAQKAGVQLPAFDGEKASQKKRIHEVNDMAVKFFRACLERMPEAETARTYVKKRGLDDLTLDLFGIGFAPESWDALTKALTSKGVTEQEMLTAGLVAKSDRGPGVYDRFRGRVMFPIGDVHGNIVGFTGRILETVGAHGNAPGAKYVNTPETSAYRKSAVLYGLDKAKGEIRREDLAVIVEGNMDVVGSHQFNVANVVASSGTALTAEQLGLLKRFTTNLAIAFDQDAAGNAATVRGLDLARAQDFNIKIITLPPEAGKDPDEAVRKDPSLWKDAIKNALGIMEWIYRQAFLASRNTQHASSEGEKKKEIARMVLTEIKRIVDPVERDHWIKKLAKDLDVSEGALREALQGVKKQEIGASRQQEAGVGRRESGGGRPQGFDERVLANLLARFDLLKQGMDEEKLDRDDFEHPDMQGLYEAVKSAYAAGEMAPDPLVAGQAVRPPASLGPEEAKTFDRLAFLAEREFQGWTLEQLKRELKTGASQLRLHRKKRERERLEQQMREAERLGDQARIKDLERQFQSLM